MVSLKAAAVTCDRLLRATFEGLLPPYHQPPTNSHVPTNIGCFDAYEDEERTLGACLRSYCSDLDDLVAVFEELGNQAYLDNHPPQQHRGPPRNLIHKRIIKDANLASPHPRSTIRSIRGVLAVQNSWEAMAASSPPASPPNLSQRPLSGIIGMQRSSSRLSVRSKQGTSTRVSDEDAKTSVRVGKVELPALLLVQKADVRCQSSGESANST